MRPVLPVDVSAAARALLAVPAPVRAAWARRLIKEACAADAYCRQTGRAHGRWGNGTLMAAAHGHPIGNEVCFDDLDYLDCQVRVLTALRAYRQAEAQGKQRMTVGSSSRRRTAMSSPQSTQ